MRENGQALSGPAGDELDWWVSSRQKTKAQLRAQSLLSRVTKNAPMAVTKLSEVVLIVVI
ncbi:MAG: hypothetical protein BGP09_25540 [Rhizobium sp. 60-20]|nr:MAG: hypothetical protein BGP09_25540 [Rhizobium sp. 60-20]